MITFPNCKINIGLHVLEKRTDGFHNIETVLVPVEWSDILEIIPDEKPDGEIDFKSTGTRVFGSKDKNLCTRAYNLLLKDHKLPAAKMHLHKIIPVGAGLGGGSSDAAYTLMLLNEMFGLKINDEELEKYAGQLGSDCPFFIGNKPVLAIEKGDVFEQIKIKLKNIHCVIVKPRVHISTVQAYSWVKPQKRKTSLAELIQLPITEWKSVIENDFEKAVFEKHPQIKNIKARLYKLGAVYASMTGSGSAVYGLFNEEKHLDTYFRSNTIWSGNLTASK